MVMKIVRVVVAVVNLILGCWALFLGALFILILPLGSEVVGNLLECFGDFSPLTFIPAVLTFTFAIAAVFGFQLILCTCLMIISAVYFFRTIFYNAYSAKKKYTLLLPLVIMLAFFIFVIFAVGPIRSIVFFCTITAINITLLLYDCLHPDLREEDEE